MLSQAQQQYHQPLILLKKYHQYLETKSNSHIDKSKPFDYTQILVHERFVYLMATALQNNQTLPKQDSRQFSLLSELTAFINKVNIKVMSVTLQEMNFDDKLNLISKCLDMLFYKSVKNNVRPPEKLLQLRALTFNNLSCLYKENKQLEDALKALQVSLQIQQTLLTKNFEDTYKSIASTYINKCVILSSLSLHEQAIETIKTSLDNINRYQEKFKADLKDKDQQEIKHMMMLAYFNIAVEHQHIAQEELALKFYEMAFKLAKELNNWSLKNQSLAAIKKLKKKV